MRRRYDCNKMNLPAVPVIMHHSIGVKYKDWLWNHLTCPYQIFEDQLKWLKKKKFHTISLQQLYDYMKNRSELPENPIVLTFDDGYLDNWMFAYPLLKKYGLKGTIFVSPEFVDPTEEYRAHLGDVWTKKADKNQLRKDGFLSWREMKEMEADDVMDIQSHALTHTWYFKGSRIVDFRHPGDSYIWMTWNNYPERKPYLQVDDEELKDFGAPVYEYGKALEIKRYFPDERMKTAMVDYVEQNGREGFFRDDWRTRLFERIKDYRRNHHIEDRYETNAQYNARIRGELEKSKKIIEKHMEKEVKFLCWPGGGVNETALKIAQEAGYASSTYSSKETLVKKLWNMPGEDPSRFRRIGTAVYWDGRADSCGKMVYQNGFLLLLSLSDFQRKKVKAALSRLLHAGIKKMYEIRSALFTISI